MILCLIVKVDRLTGQPVHLGVWTGVTASDSESERETATAEAKERPSVQHQVTGWMHKNGAGGGGGAGNREGDQTL